MQIFTSFYLSSSLIFFYLFIFYLLPIIFFLFYFLFLSLYTFSLHDIFSCVNGSFSWITWVGRKEGGGWVGKVKEKESLKFCSHAFDPSPTHHNSPIQFKWPTRTWVGSRFLFFIIKQKTKRIYIFSTCIRCHNWRVDDVAMKYILWIK